MCPTRLFVFLTIDPGFNLIFKSVEGVKLSLEDCVDLFRIDFDHLFVSIGRV
jgi:hypothetical protein